RCGHQVVSDTTVLIAYESICASVFERIRICADIAWFQHHVDVSASNLKTVNDIGCSRRNMNCCTFWDLNDFIIRSYIIIECRCNDGQLILIISHLCKTRLFEQSMFSHFLWIQCDSAARRLIAHIECTDSHYNQEK